MTGARKDPARAKQIGCIPRDDHEDKARSNGQVLIPCAALAEREVKGGPGHAERILELGIVEEKRAWFRQ